MDTTDQRMCANCCSWDEGGCLNGVGDVRPGDRCEQQRSPAEDGSAHEALSLFRVAVGLPPLRGGE